MEGANIVSTLNCMLDLRPCIGRDGGKNNNNGVTLCTAQLSSTHAVHMLYTCCTHAVHMLYTCCTHAVHMLYTCCTHAVHTINKHLPICILMDLHHRETLFFTNSEKQCTLHIRSELYYLNNLLKMKNQGPWCRRSSLQICVRHTNGSSKMVVGFTLRSSFTLFSSWS